MTEYVNTRDFFVADGILHDQQINDIALHERTLTLTFDGIEWFDDYNENEYALKYKGFTKCTVSLNISEYDSDHTVDLYTVIHKNGTFKGVELSLRDFIRLSTKKEVTVGYIGLTASSNTLVINLSFYAKKGKYKKFFTAALHTCTDQIEYVWE